MEIVNFTTWDRTEHYNFFRNMDYPQYNICMNIDITNFLKSIKEKKLPFYYSMVYAATFATNDIRELRYRIHGDQVILHDRIHPSFTDMTPGQELFKLVTLNLEDTLEDFVTAAKRKSENQTKYFPFEDIAGRDDLIYITCIPWISFTHLSHTINLRKDDAVPRISWGKYFKQEDKVLLPFSVQVHHALADGYHVGMYVERLQEYLDSFYIR